MMGGCCDKCGKQLVQALKAAYLAFANNAAQCCNRATPESADACIGERQAVFDETNQLAIAAKAACDMGNQQLMNEVIKRILDRLPSAGDPASPMTSSVPIENASGKMVNAMPLLGCYEVIAIASSATADGQWKAKTTAVVNGREVLPEAAGRAAVTDEAAQGQDGVAITEILLASQPNALKFAEYTFIDGGFIRYDSGAFLEDFALSGTFSISEFKQQAGGDVVALPGDARIALVGHDGAIHLALDKAQPKNILRINPDGSGVLKASFLVRGTEDYDFLPSMYEKVWLEIPLQMNGNDLSIDFAALGTHDGCDIAPYGSDTPGEDFEPAQDGFPRACDLIDTNGDGVPDTTRIEYELKQDLEELVDIICE